MGTFTLVVKQGRIVAGRIFIRKCTEFVMIGGEVSYINEMILFLLMLSSIVKFSTDFFSLEFVFIYIFTNFFIIAKCDLGSIFEVKFNI